MKTIKTLLQINYSIIGMMVLLYFTLWGGILLQILLGIVQLCFYIYLLKAHYKDNDTLRAHLIIYGALTLLLLSLLTISGGDLIFYVWVGSVPLIIYFTYILHQTKKVQS